MKIKCIKLSDKDAFMVYELWDNESQKYIKSFELDEVAEVDDELGYQILANPRNKGHFQIDRLDTPSKKSAEPKEEPKAAKSMTAGKHYKTKGHEAAT